MARVLVRIGCSVRDIAPTRLMCRECALKNREEFLDVVSTPTLDILLTKLGSYCGFCGENVIGEEAA